MELDSRLIFVSADPERLTPTKGLCGNSIESRRVDDHYGEGFIFELVSCLARAQGS